MTRGRLIGASLVLALVALALVAVLTAGSRKQPLDPGSAAPDGARAVAQVLRAQGVSVHVTHTAAGLVQQSAGPDSTVVVTRAGLLGRASLHRIAQTSSSAGSLVLIAPTAPVLADLGLPIREVPGARSDPGQLRCSTPPFDGLRFDGGVAPRSYTSTVGAGCARLDDGGDAIRTLPAVPGLRPAVVVIGSDQFLRNRGVLSADDAAIALRALGSHPRLVWVAADTAHADASATGSGEASPWPRWLGPGTWLVAACVVLLMLWRGRRLGRLVTEPLPVVVPAVETTLSRGQLYRRARDTARTAEVLRIASRHRLARYLGLAPTTPAAELVRETAQATRRDAREVHDVLVGGPVDDEAQLIRTAQELQNLERQVHRP
ncbi:DUF4350 domain-containing protein [Allobranchiibius sp. CTAmp26]|uniref:DUF4350 domain-containing protein n=1 Tax=Allobranchiibius sp. CTAmp26 TaxID=2815214 RepID=UPI001AA0F436|nr:DUF4350 domain-containing protein [Allobranchiibius sp. CTAmp26]MBO1755807.1 DUF4350 domain-containing protein [Allobranchiibius sp. CTAmp26]